MNETQEYQVLARKYRPMNFDDLVGQQALVRTLTNALKVGRIASAFVLTGVRGVGKTTTARIVAKALNCDKTDENGNPPIKPCGTCTHCENIAHGTHMDVLEMDAASHTSIDDIRDIIESTQYKPVTARYKVFILDEVHMLSKSAFNALLKILEEPPAHVKFILATTDIDKVPVTVLSRCQRFDLRRITVQDLIALYTKISDTEGFDISPDAVRTIAVAADGSARDGLSILDQALALSTDKSVDMPLVVSMLGLADKQAIYDIFESLMGGDVPSVLDKVTTLYNAGADPLAILNALIDVNWLLTRVLHTPQILDELSVSELERTACVQMSKSLTVPILTRTWQVLQKGIAEIAQTDRPIMALEMVLIRVAYMAHVPSVASLVKSVQSGANNPVPTTTTPKKQAQPQTLPQPTASQTNPQPVVQPPVQKPHTQPQSPPTDIAQSPTMLGEYRPPENFSDWVQMFKDKEPILGNEIWRNAGLVSYAPPVVTCTLQGDNRETIQKMHTAIGEVFGQDWRLNIVQDGGQPTLQQQQQNQKQAVLDEVEQLPEIQAIKNIFPNATVKQVNKITPPEHI